MIEFNIDNYLRISWQDVLLVCISSFLIVVFCKHFFWNKILDFIAKRQAVIQSNIDASVEEKKRVEKLKEDWQKKMDNAGEEAGKIIDSARKQALVQKDEILDKARQEAQIIEKNAREEVEQERMKAASQMKDAITDVAIAAAGQILQQEVDETRQKQLLDDFITQAGEGKW